MPIFQVLADLYQSTLAILKTGGRKGRLAALRAAWGKPLVRERDMMLVAILHDLKGAEGVSVDEVTWPEALGKNPLRPPNPRLKSFWPGIWGTEGILDQVHLA